MSKKVPRHHTFSDKSWSDGINPERDEYHRFEGYGIPPEKNGDWAWFLHVLKSLKEGGKAAIIMPHGILFRGNSEATIRKQVLERRYITGIVSLPGNLFYGTGIPACIVVIDKENAEEHAGIFMIDASQGFKKEGAKNRLREQDIERIVRTFTSRTEIESYSREVSYEEILEANDGNLNVPRYIQRVSDELPQDITAHLQGGIPKNDVDSLDALWDIAPDLKQSIFQELDTGRYQLLHEPDELAALVAADEKLVAQKRFEAEDLIEVWADQTRPALLSVSADTEPRMLIRYIGADMLQIFRQARILDRFDVFDVLMNYWNEKLQDDIYILKASGFNAGREIEYVYGTKKAKDAGETIAVEDTGKVKSFDGVLIPASLIESEYFVSDQVDLTAISSKIAQIEAELETILEDQPEEDNLFTEVLSSTGKVIEKQLNARIAALDLLKKSPELAVLDEIFEHFTAKRQHEVARLLKQHPNIAELDIYGKNGKPIKTKLTAARAQLATDTPVPEAYREEYEALAGYASKNDELKALKKQAKEARTALDEKVKGKYEALTTDEIKHLLFDLKWVAHIRTTVSSLYAQQIDIHASRC